jgi:predicted nucleic acid-binding protein
VVAADPDDDAVIACAVGADADVIVSGDHHLLDLGKHGEITIVTARQLLARIAREQG